jgi:hypothetical protein
LFWAFNGFVHAVICYVVPYIVFQESILDPKGENNDILTFGITVFTNLFLVVHFKLIMSTKYNDPVTLTIFAVCSYWFYPFFLWFTDDFYLIATYHFTFERLFGNLKFFIVILLTSGTCLLLDLIQEYLS